MDLLDHNGNDAGEQLGTEDLHRVQDVGREEQAGRGWGGDVQLLVGQVDLTLQLFYVQDLRVAGHLFISFYYLHFTQLLVEPELRFLYAFVHFL